MGVQGRSLDLGTSVRIMMELCSELTNFDLDVITFLYSFMQRIEPYCSGLVFEELF